MPCYPTGKKEKEKGHFKAPSAGSYFKNDYSVGVPTGVLIEEVGMKGEWQGGAQIARGMRTFSLMHTQPLARMF